MSEYLDLTKRPFGPLHRIAFDPRDDGKPVVRAEGDTVPADPQMAARFDAYQQQPPANRVVPPQDVETNRAMMRSVLRHVRNQIPYYSEALQNTPLRNGPREVTPKEWAKEGLYVTRAVVAELLLKLSHLILSEPTRYQGLAPPAPELIRGSQNDWREDSKNDWTEHVEKKL